MTLALLALLLASCAKKVPAPALAPVSTLEKTKVVLEIVPEDQWPLLFDDLDANSFRKVCQQSIEYLCRQPEDRAFDYGDCAGPYTA